MFTDDFAVMIGNTKYGTVYNYTHGNFSLHTPVETASTSKWPLAMTLAGLVDDGTISSFDTPVHEYVPWWTSNKSDARAYITFRHLLSFTSGFGDGQPGQENQTKTCMDNKTADYMQCAKHLYATTKILGIPGETYSYNSVHLQLAGAIAVHASGLPNIEAVIKKYLIDAYQLNETTCGRGGTNPVLAVCLQTTAYDYSKFLTAQLGATVLSADTVAQSEKDYTPFMDTYYTLYGSYGFGHFIACFDSLTGETKACKEAKTHIDPGAFGFYPLIDRKYGYYMQVVAYEHTNKTYPRSGIPEYLGLALKPYVDVIMSGRTREGPGFFHHTPLFNSLSLFDINYMAGCYIKPETCT